MSWTRTLSRFIPARWPGFLAVVQPYYASIVFMRNHLAVLRLLEGDPEELPRVQYATKRMRNTSKTEMAALMATWNHSKPNRIQNTSTNNGERTTLISALI